MSTPLVRMLVQFALTASFCRRRVSDSHLDIATKAQMISATAPNMIMTLISPICVRGCSLGQPRPQVPQSAELPQSGHRLGLVCIVGPLCLR